MLDCVQQLVLKRVRLVFYSSETMSSNLLYVCVKLQIYQRHSSELHGLHIITSYVIIKIAAWFSAGLGAAARAPDRVFVKTAGGCLGSDGRRGHRPRGKSLETLVNVETRSSSGIILVWFLILKRWKSALHVLVINSLTGGMNESRSFQLHPLSAFYAYCT